MTRKIINFLVLYGEKTSGNGCYCLIGKGLQLPEETISSTEFACQSKVSRKNWNFTWLRRQQIFIAHNWIFMSFQMTRESSSECLISKVCLTLPLYDDSAELIIIMWSGYFLNLQNKSASCDGWYDDKDNVRAYKITCQDSQWWAVEKH